MESTVVRWPLRCCPRVTAAGRFTHRDPDPVRDWRNPDLTLHLFAYAATVTIGEAEIAVRPGDLTLTPPGTTLRFAFTRPGIHWCLRLTPAAGAGRLVLAPHHRLSQPEALEARRRIEAVIADHVRAGGDPDHPAAVGAGLATQGLLCWLAARTLPAPVADAAHDPVEKARLLLANPQCAKVPIADIARRAGMSQNRLATAFRRRHGQPMAQYRTRMLVEHAMQLMQTTGLDLDRIRQRIEINDLHHFYKVFRRVAGVGPRAWRAAQKPLGTSSPRPG